MGKLESRRKTPEERWDAPSGRVRTERSVIPPSLRRLLSSGACSSRGRIAAKPRVGTLSPGPSSRRVVVKVRVVQVGQAWGKKAAALHLAYLEREGVERDGGQGSLYGPDGPAGRADFEQDLPGEKHQFRIVLSPEDGHELDLQGYVRSYMRQVEKDLNRKLLWAAVNHYNTDQPHAHLIIRGVDADGHEVRMDREYVSHGLRNRAVELATYELGPRTERERIEQLQREARLERWTSLDRQLEQRAVDGVLRGDSRRARDPHLQMALEARLETLEKFGLAKRRERGVWALHPNLGAELRQMAEHAEGLRAISAVVAVSPNRCRVILRDEPREATREELERGVQGVVRWKGLDDHGQFCAVVESTGGCAYHLPISNRLAQNLRVGQALDLKRAVDKDERIEELARQRGGACDVSGLPELAREAYRRRLEQLERMGLAAAETPDRWRVRDDFRAQISAQGKRQPYWQMLALRPDAQPLRDQVLFVGSVWLDRVRLDEAGPTGFGREVREAIHHRRGYLRGLGVDLDDAKLRWKLQELQRRELEQRLAADGSRAIQAVNGLEGTARLHRGGNGEAFLEIRSGSNFSIQAASRKDQELAGRAVRVELEDGRRVRVKPVDRDVDRDRGS